MRPPKLPLGARCSRRYDALASGSGTGQSEFLTGVKRVALGVSGPAWSGFVDSYLVGSLTGLGRWVRRRASGGMVYRWAMIASASAWSTGRPSMSRTM